MSPMLSTRGAASAKGFGLTASSAAFNLTWSTATVSGGPVLGYTIGYGNNIFLCGPRTNGVNYYTSSDGISWTTRTRPADIEPGGWAGAYFVYFLFGTSTFYKTSDGISWTSGTVSGGVQNGRFSGPLTTNGTTGNSTVALQSVNVNALQYAKTTDGGNTWSGSSLSGASDFNGVQIAYAGSNLWGYSGELNSLGYSSDGTNFSRVSTPSGNAGAVFGGNGILIFRSGTAGTTYYTSTNGSSWTSRSFPVSGVYNFGWTGTRWIATQAGGTSSYHSLDAISWTSATNNKESNAGFQYQMATNNFVGGNRIVLPGWDGYNVSYASAT